MTHKLRRILINCPLEVAEAHALATLKSAADLAADHGAQITVLRVIDKPDGLPALAKALRVSLEEIEKRLHTEEERRLRALIDTAGLPSSVPSEVRLGKSFLETIRAAIALEADLVVKPAESAPGLPSFLFASTDQHLLRKCPCPVWLRMPAGGRPQTEHRPKTILAAVDVSEEAALVSETGVMPEDRGDSLNRRILHTAMSLAADDAQVYVLHVWDAPEEGLVRLWSNRDRPPAEKAGNPGIERAEDSLERYITDLRSAHWHALERELAFAAGERHHAASVSAVMERGRPREVIPSEALRLSADVVVMGTIARTGIPGFIIGNTAEDILNTVTCDVVTVKPPGYRSPVAS